MKRLLVMLALAFVPTPAYLPECRFDPPEVEVPEIEGAMRIEVWREPDLPSSYLTL